MTAALAYAPSALAMLLSGLVVMAVWRLRLWLRVEKHKQGVLPERINALLPQTQCGHCGYPGCLPYARAIGTGEAINKCAPGGPATIELLAELLNETPRPLNPAHGSHQGPLLASIREAECIGCTKCLPACPVDAIIGGPKLMHTVIAQACTGCDLCVAPCPVDCIDMVPRSGAAMSGLASDNGHLP